MKDINGDGVVDKKDIIVWSLLAGIVVVFAGVVVTTISNSTIVDPVSSQASAINAVPLQIDVVMVPAEEATTTAQSQDATTSIQKLTD